MRLAAAKGLLNVISHGMEGVDFTSGPGYLSTETFSLLAPLMLIGLGIALGTGAIAA